MKKKLTFLGIFLFLNSIVLSLSSPSVVVEKHMSAPTRNKAKSNTLRIYNWEDYIAAPEDEDDDTFDTLEAFKEYYLEEHGEEVNVVYDTFSTNEDMYNIVKLNGGDYDLIAPSDYMIQRMIKEEMLEEFDMEEDGTYTNVPVYNEYASPYHQDIFAAQDWTKYAIGYMWGTFGLLYAAEATPTIDEDMLRWSVLWDEKYNKKISIKDSMREAYLVGLFQVHEEELLSLAADYKEGELSAEDYNAQINDLLNDVSPEAIKGVNESLRELKKNIYGLEVDQGKTDMIKGIIDVNTAWSGDAVYSISETVDEESGLNALRYVIPEEGSNIWFDGWVMPKGANKELAQEFLNFMSDPEVAIENMDYIGYTSFIAGQDVLDYVNDYDEISDDGYEIDLRYFFEGTIEEEDDAVIYIDEDFIGGQLATQFPTYDEVVRSAVMRDFGDTNKLVIDMWANFKATEIQTWMIVFSVLILLGVGGLITYSTINKYKAARRKRNVRK